MPPVVPARLEAAARLQQQLLAGVQEVEAEVKEKEEALAAGWAELEEGRAALLKERATMREKFEEEKREFEAEKQAVASTNATTRSKIKLDVGGTMYASSRTTLTSVPGSMLEAMFSGRHALEEDDEGRIFIDRDGAAFKLILEYLRSPTTFTLEGLSARDVKMCLAEFEYFGLPSPMPPAPPVPPRMNTGVQMVVSLQPSVTAAAPSRTAAEGEAGHGPSVPILCPARQRGR